MQAVTNRFHSQNSLKGQLGTSLCFITALLFILPVLVGLIGIVIPAMDYFPPLGHISFSTAAIDTFLATPGLWKASLLSMKTGLLATATSLIGCFILLVVFYLTPAHSRLTRLIIPLVAIPHSAIAIGFVFLLTPSGFLLRLISPGLTGFTQPPTWELLPDPFGIALVVGLIAKELPFLMLLALSASATMPIVRLLNISAGLGYGRFTSWVFIVLPLIYRQIRLPVIAVLVFSVSVVDMALLLAPTLPPPLAILVLHGFHDPDLAARLPASVGALWQVGLAGAAILIWHLIEIITTLTIRCLRWQGCRIQAADHGLKLGAFIVLLPVGLGLMGIITAMIWSITKSWFFPSAAPTKLTLMHWQDAASFFPLVLNSFYLAVTATCLAIGMVLLWLYQGQSVIKYGRLFQAAIYLPLLIPQVSFLFGLQIGLSWVGMDGSWLALIYIHIMFIMPYAWLILMPAVRKMDLRYDSIARSLGLGPWRRFYRLHLPLLAFPIGNSLFIGMAVSIALYLPTIFVGGGRIGTITVEAVSLAASGSRGPAGVAAILQILLPVICYGSVQLFLKRRFSQFANMHGGGIGHSHVSNPNS